MKTWRQFLEAKEGKAPPVEDKELEDKEEELGVDLDDDGEEGESEEHKKKVFGDGPLFCKTCKKSKKSCKCSKK